MEFMASMGGSTAPDGTEQLTSLGRVMSELVHDLSNEIMVLQGWALLAQSEVSAGRLPNREAGRVVELATELGQMLRDVLGTLGRTDASAEVAFDPGALTEHVLARRMLELSEHEVRLETRVTPGTRVAGKSSFWVRIVANLLGNALRYAEREILVTVERDAREDRVRLRISDDGPGVPVQDREQIFQPLWKGEAGGTGLGLGAVSWLSTQLGGTVRYVDEGPLRGATLEVEVPVAPALSLPHLVTETRPTEALTGRRVVVIDDDPVLRRVLVRVLGRLGADARELSPTSEPEERLIASLVGAMPDLILLDLGGPGSGGLSLWRTLKMDLPDLARRVIFVSGAGGGDPDWNLAVLTGQPLLAKPLDPTALRRAVVRLTSDGRAS